MASALVVGTRVTAVCVVAFFPLCCGGETDSTAKPELPVVTTCLQYTTEGSCCENNCAWIPAKGGVSQQCVPEIHQSCVTKKNCPSGTICIERQFEHLPCVPQQTHEENNGSSYFCHDECPPDAKMLGERCIQANP
ncbi:MAG: hypothetical protein R3B13_18865 [Polyangiaceae bacterium]